MSCVCPILAQENKKIVEFELVDEVVGKSISQVYIKWDLASDGN